MNRRTPNVRGEAPSGAPSPANELRGLLLLLLGALCLWALAYQIPLAQTIHVGGETALARREDDDPFLRGENGSEPADRIDEPADPRGYVWWFEQVRRTGELPYRWMTGDAETVMPGAGGGPYVVELLARSGRPDGSPAASVWTPGSAAPLQLSLPAGEPRRYRILVPTNAYGDVRLTMRTESYSATDDPRELGFVLHQIRLSDVGGPLRAPAWPTLGWLTLTVGVVYGLARALHTGPGGSLALAGGAAVAAAAALAAARPALTIFTPGLGALAVSCATLGAMAWPLARWAVPMAANPEVGRVLGLVLLAFALRMGGMLHPHALFSDLGLHANKLFEVALGRVFFTTGLPSDIGGGQQPYPPGAYLLLLPGQLLAAGEGPRRLLVQGGTALFDSLTVALIWGLVRCAGYGPRAALLAAACYLLPTPALESFSIGEYANLAGQALVLPLLALIGLGRLAPKPQMAAVHRSSSIILLTAAVALGLLAHSGVTLSVGALVAAAWAIAWAGRLRGRSVGVSPVLLTAGAAGGLGVALLVYYTAPLFLGLLTGRGGSGGQGTAPLLVLADTARALLGLAPPQDTRVALPPLLGLAGAAGFVLLLRQRSARAAPLETLLGAWWAGAALTLGLLMLAGQGVRWAIFLYPALCVGAGVALDALWRLGRAGRLAAAAFLVVILGGGVLAWVVQIRDFIHI